METKMTEHLSMTGTDRATVPHPAVPAPAGRFTRRVARSLNWGSARVTAPAQRWTVNGLAAAGLMAATAVGLLLSVYVGLFGFRESMAVPYAGMSLVVEFTGAVLLTAAAAIVLRGRPRRRPRTRSERVWPPADRP
jgi:hypothetical protein